MPELAELRLTSDYINDISQGKVFTGILKNPLHKGETIQSPFSKFKITAKSRGKELVLTLHDLDSEAISNLRMTMGMSGHFSWIGNTHISKHSHLKFQSDAGSLDFVDVRRFGKWKFGSWSENRGPDPTQEYLEFANNIKLNLDKPEFKKPICEVLMNQKYFNGIGNYLRAEILYRANVNPWTQAKLAIENTPELLPLCKSVSLTAYELGGGQLKDWENPFGESSESWSDFMKCYGNPKMSKSDWKGRTVWYDPKWDKQTVSAS